MAEKAKQNEMEMAPDPDEDDLDDLDGEISHSPPFPWMFVQQRGS